MSTVKIDPHIAENILSMQFSGTSGQLPQVLSRTDYQKAEKVIKAAGGTWSRKLRSFVFESEAHVERLLELARNGHHPKHTEERTLEFFPTPLPVVQEMLDWAELEPGMRVLEPSAGKGAIAIPLLQNGMDVTVVEIFSAFSQELSLKFGKNQVMMMDFTELQPGNMELFDRVLMNPPFSRGQDVRHVTHALKFLKPGGILVSVMSPGFTFRNESLFSDFRRLVQNMNAEVRHLPEGSFKPSGTAVNTVLVKFTQPV